MRRLYDILRSDEGMSLAELVVASVIGLLVLGAAYLLFETGMKGFRQVENQTLSGRTASQALQRMERPLREAGTISTATAYDIAFLSDPDDDNTLENLHFWIPSGSTDLMMQRADNGVTSTPVVVATGIRNRTTGVPMFTFFRDIGLPVTALQAGETTGTASRIVRLVVVTQPTTPQTPAPPSYTVQTDIFLRSRSQ